MRICLMSFLAAYKDTTGSFCGFPSHAKHGEDFTAVSENRVYQQLTIWGVPARHGGTPSSGWFISGKVLLEWMIEGYPYDLGNHHLNGNQMQQ